MVEGAGASPVAFVSLAETLEARPGGISEPETWALLCQAVQALQDLFLSDGASGGRFAPVLSPAALLLSSRGRVTLPLGRVLAHAATTAAAYAAPEYRTHGPHGHGATAYSDSEVEKMLVYSLGECLKRAVVPGHAAATHLSAELCGVLAGMGAYLAAQRATLMHLLHVISEYSKRREQQSKPFSHIVMDLYRETIIYRNSKPVLPDCAMQPHLKQHMVQPCSNRNELLSRRVETIDNCKTISNKWRNIRNQQPLELDYPRQTRNLFTSLEQINKIPELVKRPKSICTNEELFLDTEHVVKNPRRRRHMKRNPVKRAASRLYHVTEDVARPGAHHRPCIGPEFVIRASLPSKQLFLGDSRYASTITITVIMLNGVKLEVHCKPEVTTAGQLFEKIIRSEDIEENYFLGLSVLISGDFVFLPSDVKLSKIITTDNASDARSTLFVRVRFFLPSLRGIRSQQSRHLLYLQLRRSLLENQLPCTFNQLYELAGLALQAEFGDFTDKHGASHYFLLEHYMPEMMICNLDSNERFRDILTQAHIQRKGLSVEKAEEDFILLAQSLPYYGVHFYSATLVTKSIQRDVWLCVSAQGISLYERNGTVIPSDNPVLCEVFNWQAIQTLCYSKHYLCILPHCTLARKSLPRKYKLKMDHKKSYYTFRLASLHHQFFLRLRTEYSSLQSLSQQFGVLLKDMKNEANSLFKLATHDSVNAAHINQEPNSVALSNNEFANRTSRCKRSKSVNELNYRHIPLEEFQNKENESPREQNTCNNVTNVGKVHGANGGVWDKRKGVKMGTRAFASNGQRMSRSLEAVNAWASEENEQLSMDSSSRLSNSSSGVVQNANAYVLNSSIKSLDDQFLPDLHETLSQSLMDKLKNLSFADERILKSVTLLRDSHGSLGIQVTEGSDGKVYIQSVVARGPASITGNVFKGDQIVAVDGQNLLNLNYSDALQLLKKTDNKVELVLSSQLSTSQVAQTSGKHLNDVSTKQFNDLLAISNQDDRLLECNYYDERLHISNSCKCNSYSTLHDQRNYQGTFGNAPGGKFATSKHAATGPQDSEPRVVHIDFDVCDVTEGAVPHIPLPRSLGLGRRWRGPVRYPVTPIKNPTPAAAPLNTTDVSLFLNASDEEQIFI